MTILKINDEIKQLEEKGMPQSQIEKQVELLQFATAALFNNELNGCPQPKLKSGKPIKSIRERLRGKQGRLRYNLMGKRVDFSARTVVSPDPNLAVNQLGVPKTIALNLTFPEIVTPLNMERLKKLVINGPTEWPGAKSIIRPDGKVFDLRFTKDRASL
jgi:DNA-directed RNA polymerase beta' subunit